MNKGGKSCFHLADEATEAQINQILFTASPPILGVAKATCWLRVISYEMPVPV